MRLKSARQPLRILCWFSWIYKLSRQQKSIEHRKAPTTLLLAVTLAALWLGYSALPTNWTDAEIKLLHSLWIGSLNPLTIDASNSVADDPRAAKLGQHLFFDKRMSGNGTIACSTCHQPERRFTDGLSKGQAIGQSKRNTPSIIGVAYSPWLYWDGRRDSLWSQAISPLEDPNEHGGNRMYYVHLVATDPDYKYAYEEIFGILPNLSDQNRFPANAAPVANPEWNAAWLKMTEEDRDIANKIYSNIGKSIAAYERILMPGPSRFDHYVEAVMSGDEETQQQLFNNDEKMGLRLFLGKANCTQCHNGPLLTNNEFHNTGVISFPEEIPDQGRVKGVLAVQLDPFNCLGAYADASDNDCAELRFVRTGPELIGAIRTPSLRNLEDTEPFMHKGQLKTIAEVLDHYNRAPMAMIGHNEAKPLGFSARELQQLESFLGSLAAPPATPGQWLQPPIALTR